MRRHILWLAIGAFGVASVASAEPAKVSNGSGDVAKAPVRLTDGQTQKAQAPIRLTDTQMEKVVAGKYTLDPLGDTSTNSCNSGKCSYDNPHGNEIGKPVTGFNN